MKNTKINIGIEVFAARICLIATIVLFFLALHFIGHRALVAFADKKYGFVFEAFVFASAIAFMAYSSVLYEISLIGYYKRRKKHVPVSRNVLDRLYTMKAPKLSILIPSYKEEKDVVWQTMVSSALSEYPSKNVVLLIDDPYNAKALEDMLMLDEARRLPQDLQVMFDAAADRFHTELDAFHARKRDGHVHYAVELNRLSILYDEAADWLAKLAKDFLGGKETPTHTDQYFVNKILLTPAEKHRAFAETLRHQMTLDGISSEDFLEQNYARLAGLFHVTFSSFERKKYQNLSHEANKAMNLNSYIALMGKSWKEVETPNGYELHEVANDADFSIEAPDFVNVLDADSLMFDDYLIKMIEMMSRPENERLGLIQPSVSSDNGSHKPLERTIAAGFDFQFINNQGYTEWNATYWVGINAIVRYSVLQDIKEIKMEGDKQVAVYVKNETVIEDTETAISIVDKGWRIHHYPETLAFSAVPPDFGSLLIQRRRWANGGMIILPKLFKYIAKSGFSLAGIKEFFMRFYYIAGTTLGCSVLALLTAFNFGNDFATLWIMLASVPATLLYYRTLVVFGYRGTDILRITALNLMLIPVLFGGVLKQFEQMLTGKKIPFCRTPKVPGRTAAPAMYCLLELFMLIGFTVAATYDVTHARWVHAAFTTINAMFMTYALVQFIGVNALMEDISASVRLFIRNRFHQAQILPFYSFSKPDPFAIPERKRA